MARGENVEGIDGRSRANVRPTTRGDLQAAYAGKWRRGRVRVPSFCGRIAGRTPWITRHNNGVEIAAAGDCRQETPRLQLLAKQFARLSIQLSFAHCSTS